MSDTTVPTPPASGNSPDPRTEGARPDQTLSMPVAAPEAGLAPDAPVTPPTFAPPTFTPPTFASPAGTRLDPYAAPSGTPGPYPIHHATQHHLPPQASPYGAQPGGPYGAPPTSHSAFGVPVAQAPGSQPPAQPPVTRVRRRGPGWPGVAAAAVAAGLVASLATAGLTGAFSPDQNGSGTFSNLGREEISIPVSGSTADNPDWQVVAAAVRDSVVAITVKTTAGEGEGSGVVISESGQILTNHHVVSGGESGSITVSLADGRIYDAKIVGTDQTTDIAVIQVVDPPDDLAVATLGNSDEAVVGASVMAVGNPLGLDTTVTTGIISALDRPVSTQEQGSGSLVVTNAIQVDAAINPGNSGGPLFNSSGEVIGITSSIATLSSGGASGSIGLGFAIPVNQAQLIAEQLIENGVAEHAYLGVSLSDGTATADGTTRSGAVVETVSSGTPAERAAIRRGDVIVGIDGKAVAGAESLTGYVRQYASGAEVTLTVVRDGKATDITVTLATKPETP